MENYEKKYKEAMRTLNSYKKDEYGCTRVKPENIFPELRESEDEKIRKYIIWHLKHTRTYPDNSINNHVEEAIAWLEKQGEQKPIDKVESKFKVGDWINNGEYTWKVIDIKPLDYILQSPNGNTVDDTISYVDEHFHLWTIQDAKDGDVFCCDNGNNKTIYLFKGQRGSSNIANAYFQIFNRNNETKLMFDKAADFNLSTKTATKEQRDLLFQKMKEVGYEWDAEKKELKKIEQNPAEWSEEDERTYSEILDFFLGDIGTRCATIDKQRHFGYWLKSLKDRVQPQPKQEWSEEDKGMLNSIIDRGLRGFDLYPDQVIWLKSLKPNHWKPSEEQMEALKNAIIGKRGPLFDLYYDLEKL